MQCPNCNHDNKEGASFCEKCGAQLVEAKKRMSLFERRAAKEKERQYILSKASLQAEDLQDLKDMDMGEVEATAVSDKSKMIKITALKLSLSIIVIAISIVLIFIIGKLKFNDTLRVVLIFIVFMLCSVGGAFAIDNGYKLRMIKAMCKSPFAVKKIGYGKPPYMLIGDTFYQLKITTPCDVEGCGASMHIEEYNGEFIAVCDADRGHLRRLDCSLLNKNKETVLKEQEEASSAQEPQGAYTNDLNQDETPCKEDKLGAKEIDADAGNEENADKEGIEQDGNTDLESEKR